MSARSALTLAAAVTLSACGGDDPDVTVSTTTPPADARSAPAARTPDDAASAAKPDGDAAAPASPKADAPASGPAAGGKPGAAGVAERAAPAAAPTGGKPAPGAAASAAAAGGTQTYPGTLEDGDETLDSGEFADGYEVEATAGQTITVDLRSSDFDTYVILRSPSGEQFDNDDIDSGDTEHSQIVQRAGEGGTWRVIATSYEEGESGAYRLAIRTGGR